MYEKEPHLFALKKMLHSVHDTYNTSYENDKKTAVLPAELLRYVSVDSLYKNAEEHPMMTMKLTQIQQERVQKIKEILMQIPLIHATFSEQIAKGLSDISPLDDLPRDHQNNSQETDRSLGLTKCVFFHQGIAQRGYGHYITQFSPKILDKENVFVTPIDISRIVTIDKHPFDEFEPREKKRVEENYFKHMVTGKARKEIIARRILMTIESGNSLFRLNSDSLGEIKHYGKVSTKDYLGSFSTRNASDMNNHYRYIYEHGFAFFNMENIRDACQKTGENCGVDSWYEECGINYKEVNLFWEKVLKLKGHGT